MSNANGAKQAKTLSERTVKFVGINPMCARDSDRKPKVAPESSDLSSQWQNMTFTMIE